MRRRSHFSTDDWRLMPDDLVDHPELAALATLHHGLWIAHLALVTQHPAIAADRMYQPDDLCFRAARAVSMRALNMRPVLQEYLDALRLGADQALPDDLDF